MYYRLEIRPKANTSDPKGCGVLGQIREFLHLSVEEVCTREVFSLFVDCSEAQAREILAAFVNPIIQDGVVGETKPDSAFDWLVIVGFRPGVTDNVARSARSVRSETKSLENSAPPVTKSTQVLERHCA